MTLIVEVDSVDELGSLVLGLPAFFLSAFEVHPIADIEEVLDALADDESSRKRIKP
jgi:hypothetical protein